MHTRNTKTLFGIGLQDHFCSNDPLMLLANIGVTPAHAASTVTISGSVGLAGVQPSPQMATRVTTTARRSRTARGTIR